MIKSFIVLSSFISLFVINSLAIAEESCSHKIVLKFETTCDSSFVAKPEDAGIPFASINGQDIPFYIQPGTEKKCGYKVISSKLAGCIPEKALKAGNNSIHMSVAWPKYGDTQVEGWGAVTFLSNESVLCSMTFMGSGENSKKCDVNKYISLEELDPEKYRDLTRLTNNVESSKNKLNLTLEKYHELQTKYEELKICYEKNKNLPLAELYNNNCGEADVVSTLENIKKNIDTLQAEITALKNQAQDKYKKISEIVQIELAAIGVVSDNLSEVKTMFSEIEIPEFKLPTFSDAPKFDKENDIYKSYATNVITNLEKHMAGDDRFAFLLATDTWLANASQILDGINSKTPVLEGELEAFNSASKEVDVIIEKYIDLSSLKNGVVWFNNSPIPNSLKNTITNDISLKNPELAKELSKSLILWRGQELTKEQRAIVTLMQVAGKAIVNMPSTVDAINKSINNKIISIVNKLKTAAIETGKAITYVSPAGDYIDFCEMVTGYEFCNVNGIKLSISARALSGAGLVVGNGMVWRNIAKEAKIIKEAEKIEEVVKESEKIIDSAGKFEFKTGKEIKAFGKVLEAVETLPAKLKVQRIRKAADPSKVAIVGRSMPGVVNDTAAHLGSKGITAKTFSWSKTAQDDWTKMLENHRRTVGDQTARLPFDEVKKTLGYAENKLWAEDLIKDGYTVLDMGDPLGKDAIEGLSAFYEIEKQILF